MYNLPILSFITFIPLIGAMILMAVSYFSKNEAAKKQLAANSPYVALIVSVVVFLLSLLLVLNFDRTTADFQFVENMSWLGGGINYRLGVDGISVLFILLTAFLTPLCIIASQASIKDRMLEYMVAFLKIPGGVQTWLWLAFFASFAVKMPMWPVHTWLPDAHVEAPTAGSVILAGILLKLGGYGLLRFSLPLFPEASVSFAPLVFAMSVIAIIYTSLVAYRQNDMKKLIAYSSVAHMGFVTMGIFAMNVQGIQGAIFQMLSHGLISGALFFCVGVIYDRMHTREISFYGGIVKYMPVYAVFFLFFTMANVGLPGTSGFVGEILTMIGAYKVNPWVAFGAAFGMILSAVYALYLYRAVVFGEVVNEKLEGISDMTKREVLVLAPLAIFTLVLGVYPSLVTDITAVSVDNLIAGLSDAPSVTAAGGQ